MSKAAFFFLLVSSLSYGQSYERLMSYSRFYNHNIDSFIDHMKDSPVARSSHDGNKKMVFEMEGFHIGVEEHPSKKGIIGEIYIFRTVAKDAHSEWLKIHERMYKDKSFQFVKGMYDDNCVKHNELELGTLLTVLKKKDKKNNARYAVRYKKALAFYTLSVIDDNLVLTIDSKNY